MKMGESMNKTTRNLLLIEFAICTVAIIVLLALDVPLLIAGGVYLSIAVGFWLVTNLLGLHMGQGRTTQPERHRK